MPGEILTRWTIRLALLGYALFLGGSIFYGKGPGDGRGWPAAARWIWTISCVFFIAHVTCAFAFHHHWRHAEAFAVTAQRTREMLGFAFGGGIYFSYAFTLLWAADVVWLWVAPRIRPWWLMGSLHLYLFFIAFNGAIIFEGGVTRWCGIAACLLLAGLSVWRLLAPSRSLEPSV